MSIFSAIFNKIKFDIEKMPAEVLRTVAEPVPSITREHRKLMRKMRRTMRLSGGIGLAAPQVGVSERIIVVGFFRPKFLVNPEVVWASDELKSRHEGCLSLPGAQISVTRPSQVRVEYTSRWGRTKEVKAKGLRAACLQHEIDHLDGVLITV
jgi:peptide deformylase